MNVQMEKEEEKRMGKVRKKIPFLTCIFIFVSVCPRFFFPKRRVLFKPARDS